MIPALYNELLTQHLFTLLHPMHEWIFIGTSTFEIKIDIRIKIQKQLHNDYCDCN